MISIQEFASDRKKDIQEVRVIDSIKKLLAISDPFISKIMVGKTSTDTTVQRANGTKETRAKIEKDGNTGHRVQVMITPILKDSEGEVIGVIHIVASMENVYKQMKDINQIFATGTVIALLVTAVLGILLAQTITRPISDMRRQAIEMAKGNYLSKSKST